MLLRTIRIYDLQALLYMLLAYVEVSILLFLTYYLSTFFVKRIFGKWYEGDYILNKAVPYFIVSFGILTVYRLLTELLDLAGLPSTHSLSLDDAGYFITLLNGGHLTLPFLLSCIAASLYKYNEQFHVINATGESPSKVILSFAFIHILVLIFDRIVENLQDATTLHFIPNLYLPLLVFATWLYHSRHRKIK